ncbi:uncharacterized protein PV09_02252 [Verruconis gallopava]|uniref:Uncharacterized protein n=1 Tax=Verruconis gallopava TaxID=253628 RepID=A0A0D2B863_9PEZI|nr:uncharacterized protein PV09_02252 [Verruconis gallopava]KIW07409.1 hypothetical protein PV09_02252 [Verruconis gallopava]
MGVRGGASEDTPFGGISTRRSWLPPRLARTRRPRWSGRDEAARLMLRGADKAECRQRAGQIQASSSRGCGRTRALAGAGSESCAVGCWQESRGQRLSAGGRASGRGKGQGASRRCHRRPQHDSSTTPARLQHDAGGDARPRENNRRRLCGACALMKRRRSTPNRGGAMPVPEPARPGDWPLRWRGVPIRRARLPSPGQPPFARRDC